ncbi:MAG: mechanosensitive ion channel [Rhizobiaceae bacterium]|nr:mechanosensitive ion channel [Rhizobiaceae bacterium]
MKLPVIAEIGAFVSSLGLTVDDLWGRWTLVQLAILLAAFLFARLIVARTDEPIKNRLRKLEGQRALLRVLLIFHRRFLWFLISIQLWIGYLVLRSITWPSHSYMIKIMAGLATAWFVISVVSRIIKNRFLSRIVATIAWAVTALYILGLLPRTQGVLDSASFTLGEARISALSILKSGALLVIFLWLAMLFSTFIGNQISRNEDISPSVKVLLQKTLRFALLAFAVMISLSVVGIDFTALAVFSGAVGIGIGLGLQKIVSNFISGIILLLDKSIKPGDVIEIDTVSGSTYGWVQTLGARYTAVRTRDGTETLIPNETFIDSPVTNWTHTNKAVRRKLPVGVSYDTDVERAIELCIEAAAATSRVLKVPGPVCLVRGFGDSSVDLELRFWINDPEGGVANVSSLVYLEIWRRFQAENIEIPFPQRDLNIRSSVPFEFKKPK